MGKIPDPPSRAGVAAAVIIVGGVVMATLVAVTPVVVLVANALGSLEATP